MSQRFQIEKVEPALGAAVAGLLIALLCVPAAAELPQGFLVWIRGEEGRAETRKVHRMTLPDKDEVVALTTGQDVECQVSPDGRWVAFAKAKISGEADYHQFKLWSLYVVSIFGVGQGAQEVLVDVDGYWPSWGKDGQLYYSKPDPDRQGHTIIMMAQLDDSGRALSRAEVFRTADHHGGVTEMNECFMSPGGDWFAARTRGSSGVSGVARIDLENPDDFVLLGQAGNVGCMPGVAPSGAWGYLAGREKGILWGEAPGEGSEADAQLIPPVLKYAYHPGISTDERWFLSAQSDEDDHNAGAYDIYVSELSGMKASTPEPMVEGGFNGWPHMWVGDPAAIPAPSPSIVRFFPSSFTVVTGEDVILEWQTAFADTVQLEGEEVETSGEQTLAPAQTGTFTLVAASGDSEAQEALEIAVVDAPQPVAISSFAASAASVTAGETVTLSWEVDYPYTLDINGREVEPSGVLEVNPSADTTYTLTAQGHGGPVSASVAVEAEPPMVDLLDPRGGCLCRAQAPMAGRSLLSVLLAVF